MVNALSSNALWVGIITLFPEYFFPLQHQGVVARGLAEGRVLLELEPLRHHGLGSHRQVDDRPYGGGAGMVLQFQPLHNALHNLLKRCPAKQARVVFLTPQGKPLTQRKLQEAIQQPLVLIAGRYEGIDQRFIDHHVDEEWCVGDFVVSGGEIPAMMVLDGLARLVPGVLNNERSILGESFSEGRLGYPQYTRPSEVEGMQVPPLLLQGNHELIRKWRTQAALKKTWLHRPELLRQYAPSAEEICLLKQIQVEYPSMKRDEKIGLDHV